MRRIARLGGRRNTPPQLGESNTLAIGYQINNKGWVKFTNFSGLTTGAGSGVSPTDSIYADGKILVVGYQNSISTDSLIYTPQSGAGAHSFRSVAYGNGKFVAVTDANIVLYSTDGASWTAAATPLRTSLYVTAPSVCFGDGKFIISGGDGKVIKSIDGVNWITVATGILLGPVSYVNGKWFGVAKSQATKYTSNDGETWSPAVLYRDNDYSNVVYSNGKYITIRYDGYLSVSTDGINWTTSVAGLSIPSTKLVAKGLDLIYGSSDGYLVYSRNGGLSWTQKYLGSGFNFKSMLII